MLSFVRAETEHLVELAYYVRELRVLSLTDLGSRLTRELGGVRLFFPRTLASVLKHLETFSENSRVYFICIVALLRTERQRPRDVDFCLLFRLHLKLYEGQDLHADALCGLCELAPRDFNRLELQLLLRRHFNLVVPTSLFVQTCKLILDREADTKYEVRAKM
ncbi:hypothetical protein GMRT_15568 [Giardia muris]|uniref:Uncharacterized protein n=1 Tax=Giardia muris TaxID=5742 RepID=A0A4Z1SSU9_GIAMU|nr:hypothetical protein GMRT_15568 [Giardia muris]|eukprot:TNJ28840.1 hypothetical protein GMRT_15568 [Giardia muris]